jgi:hypothetical protein
MQAQAFYLSQAAADISVYLCMRKYICLEQVPTRHARRTFPSAYFVQPCVVGEHGTRDGIPEEVGISTSGVSPEPVLCSDMVPKLLQISFTTGSETSPRKLVDASIPQGSEDFVQHEHGVLGHDLERGTTFRKHFGQSRISHNMVPLERTSPLPKFTRTGA